MMIALEIYLAGMMLSAFLAGALVDPGELELVDIIMIAVAWPIVGAGCVGAWLRAAVNAADV